MEMKDDRLKMRMNMFPHLRETKDILLQFKLSVVLLPIPTEHGNE